MGTSCFKRANILGNYYYICYIAAGVIQVNYCN